MRFSASRLGAKPDLDNVSDADWETASGRAHAMEDLLARGARPSKIAVVAQELGLSKAMVYRLLARYRNNPAPTELLPKREGRVPGARRLGVEVEDVVQGLIEGYYLKKERPRVIDLYRQVAVSCRINNSHNRLTKQSGLGSNSWIQP